MANDISILHDIESHKHVHFLLYGNVDLSERDDENTPNYETHDTFGTKDIDKFNTILEKVMEEKIHILNDKIGKNNYSLEYEFLICSRDFMIELFIDRNNNNKIKMYDLFKILKEWISDIKESLDKEFKYIFNMMDINTGIDTKFNTMGLYIRRPLLETKLHGIFINNIYQRTDTMCSETEPKFGFNIHNVLDYSMVHSLGFMVKKNYGVIDPCATLSFIQRLL